MKGAANMDLLPYVESRAIREHLAAIHHRFNSLEAAVLIWNNESLSWGERIRGWRKLLRCSEDMPLPVNDWFPIPMSLHEWLKEEISSWELAKARFEQDEPGAMWLVDGERAFYTFADCREALNAGGGYAEKTWIESGAVQTIQAILEPGGGYAHIAADHSPLPLRSSVMGLGSFWIDVPTPFQKGDLLRGNDRELCILLDDERWHMTEEERRDREINGCFLDMCVLVAPVGDGSGKVGDLLAEPCPYLMLDYPDRRAEQRN